MRLLTQVFQITAVMIIKAFDTVWAQFLKFGAKFEDPVVEAGKLNGSGLGPGTVRVVHPWAVVQFLYMQHDFSGLG